MINVIVVDLDSTLYDTSPRHHLVPTENRSVNESWHPYSRAHTDDILITGMAALVHELSDNHFIWVLSGRMDVALSTTRVQLEHDGIEVDRIRLRRDDELGTVPEWKISVLREWQAETNTDIRLMLDDFPDLCAQVTAELGIPTVCPALPMHYATKMPGL